jgi:hypothetical protein
VLAGQYPKLLCEACLRAGAQPTHHYANAIVSEFNRWHELSFGAPAFDQQTLAEAEALPSNAKIVQRHKRGSDHRKEGMLGSIQSFTEPAVSRVLGGMERL